jgi:hypothetical protein
MNACMAAYGCRTGERLVKPRSGDNDLARRVLRYVVGDVLDRADGRSSAGGRDDVQTSSRKQSVERRTR